MIRNILIFTFIILTSLSCKQDKSEKIDVDNIIGSWVVGEAYRDGNKTSLLDNGYVQFDNATLKHNLAGDTITSSYTISDNILKTNDIVFSEGIVRKASKDTTEISTKFNDFKFEFILLKNEN